MVNSNSYTITYPNMWEIVGASQMNITVKQLREIADAVEQLRDLTFEVLTFRTDSHEVTIRKTTEYEYEKLKITDQYVVTGIK